MDYVFLEWYVANYFKNMFCCLSCIFLATTVAIKSIHHPVWPVTCLMKLWFHQAGYLAVTGKKKHQWVPAPEILPEIYVSMYLNYGCSLVIFCNIQTWCEGYHATLMITWIPVTIRSIKILKSTRNSLFHKYMHILLYMYINEQFSLPKTRETRGGRFLHFGGFWKPF